MLGWCTFCSQEIRWKDKHPTYFKAKFKQLIRLWKQHPKSNNLRLEYRKQNTSFRITSTHFNTQKNSWEVYKSASSASKKKSSGVSLFCVSHGFCYFSQWFVVSVSIKTLKSKWPNLRRWSDLSLWPQQSTQEPFRWNRPWRSLVEPTPKLDDFIIQAHLHRGDDRLKKIFENTNT